MKENDPTAIRDEIVRQLEEKTCTLVDYIGYENLVLCIMNVYLTNDITTGYGQEFALDSNVPDMPPPIRVSVISSPTRISIIIEGHMSFYKQNDGLCLYDSLEDDIACIILTIQTTMDRITHLM